MRVELPINVLLRSRKIACVERAAQGLDFFVLQGRNTDGTPELWRRSGHWREDKQPHPSDIVGIVGADGVLVPLTDQFSKK